MVVFMKCPHCRTAYDARDEMAREWHRTAECRADAVKAPLAANPKLPEGYFEEGAPRTQLKRLADSK